MTSLCSLSIGWAHSAFHVDPSW